MPRPRRSPCLDVRQLRMGLLRHRLLREAKGFEGLRVIPEELVVENLSLADRIDSRHLQTRLGAVASAPPEVRHDNSVRGVDEVADRLQGVRIPCSTKVRIRL